MTTYSTYRDDQGAFIGLSLFGILGWPGALAGTMLAGMADAWKGVGSGPLMPPVKGPERPGNLLLTLTFGLVAGATAFGVPGAFYMASEHGSPRLLGVLGGVICSLLPLVEEAISRRRPDPDPVLEEILELGRPEGASARRGRGAAKGTPRKRVWFPEWDKGYHVVTGVGACSLGVAALGRENPQFGKYMLGAYLACRPIAWVVKYWLHRR